MAKAKSRRERLIAGLLHLGYTRDRVTTATKYAVFLPPSNGPGIGLDGPHRVLIGKMAVRYTRSQIANSLAMSNRRINLILENADGN
jgi:hypothetical protein